ncbi:MAG TPA: metallophosphoesterase family protein, partial [Candidatus Marinimicrobia bacterium]|nr:metallophosphoesterase family protein [Candidatus Neomarinimicrobiota bacterium]
MNTRTIVFRKTIFAAALLLLMGCSGTIPTAFQHNLNEKSTPWTHNRFDNAGDKFTFAIFSDLNSGEREKVFEVAVAQLSLLRPELILSVGDLIDGGTENRETLRQEWESFDVRASRAVAPVFKVGGNHDLT